MMTALSHSTDRKRSSCEGKEQDFRTSGGESV